MERVQTIVSMAQSPAGQMSGPDELEELLQEQFRLLGISSIECWARRAEQQAAQEFKAQHSGTRYGKKNA